MGSIFGFSDSILEVKWAFFDLFKKRFNAEGNALRLFTL